MIQEIKPGQLRTEIAEQRRELAQLMGVSQSTMSRRLRNTTDYGWGMDDLRMRQSLLRGGRGPQTRATKGSGQ